MKRIKSEKMIPPRPYMRRADKIDEQKITLRQQTFDTLNEKDEDQLMIFEDESQLNIDALPMELRHDETSSKFLEFNTNDMIQPTTERKRKATAQSQLRHFSAKKALLGVLNQNESQTPLQENFEEISQINDEFSNTQSISRIRVKQ